MLKVAEVPHHTEIKPGLPRLTGLLRSPVKELQTRGKVWKHLALDENAGKPPIPIPSAWIDPVTTASLRSPLSFALWEPKRQERLKVPAPQIPGVRPAGNFQQRK